MTSNHYIAVFLLLAINTRARGALCITGGTELPASVVEKSRSSFSSIPPLLSSTLSLSFYHSLYLFPFLFLFLLFLFLFTSVFLILCILVYAQRYFTTDEQRGDPFPASRRA